MRLDIIIGAALIAAGIVVAAFIVRGNDVGNDIGRYQASPVDRGVVCVIDTTNGEVKIPRL